MADLARTSGQIGAVVRRVRKRRGLTQARLGERAGLRTVPGISPNHKVGRKLCELDS